MRAVEMWAVEMRATKAPHRTQLQNDNNTPKNFRNKIQKYSNNCP